MYSRGQMTEVNEVGSRTRRRPIGQDYAAAKHAEAGKDNAKGMAHRVMIDDRELRTEDS